MELSSGLRVNHPRLSSRAHRAKDLSIWEGISSRWAAPVICRGNNRWCHGDYVDKRILERSAFKNCRIHSALLNVFQPLAYI